MITTTTCDDKEDDDDDDGDWRVYSHTYLLTYLLKYLPFPAMVTGERTALPDEQLCEYILSPEVLEHIRVIASCGEADGKIIGRIQVVAYGRCIFWDRLVHNNRCICRLPLCCFRVHNKGCIC